LPFIRLNLFYRIVSVSPAIIFGCKTVTRNLELFFRKLFFVCQKNLFYKVSFTFAFHFDIQMYTIWWGKWLISTTAISKSKNLSLKTVISNSKIRKLDMAAHGVGWGVTADDDRGCYDPVWPRLTPRLTPFYPILVFFEII